MYNVAVDRAAMREEILGPLFQRHVVSLSGTVDQRWLESFESVQNDSDQFQRYHLDPQKGLVSFTCRASDGPDCPVPMMIASYSFMASLLLLQLRRCGFRTIRSTGTPSGARSRPGRGS